MQGLVIVQYLMPMHAEERQRAFRFFTAASNLSSMAASSPAVVMAGFSLTNRLLLYANMISAPAAFISGLGTHLPINAGFLGYTVYQQYLFYIATKHKQLHALSMLPPYLNTMYAVTYFAGISAANYWLSFTMCIGTIAALIINDVSTWMAYLTNLTEGNGVYHFFFFGWRTLSPGWRKLFLLWAVFDSLVTLIYMGVSIWLATVTPEWSEEVKDDEEFGCWQDTSLLWGSLFGLLAFWPFVLWTELIVQRNHIVSATDWISVYLFIAQIGLQALPSIFNILRRICS